MLRTTDPMGALMSAGPPFMTHWAVVVTVPSDVVVVRWLEIGVRVFGEVEAG